MRVPKDFLAPIRRTSAAAASRSADFVGLAFKHADIRGSILLGLLAVTIIWSSAWYMTSEDESRTERAAYQETSNLARAFEENIIRLIQAHDQTLLSARSTLERSPRPFDLAQWARDQKFASGVSLQIVIIDKSGMLANTTLGMPEIPMDLSDREHFRVHRDDDRDVLFISKPLLGRVSGKWSIQLSRRVSAPDGSFDGVILVAIDPFYLAAFYESIDVRRRGMVLLAGLDGVVRVRVSSGERSVGYSIVGTPFFQRITRESAGSFLTSGQIDGIRRLMSYRQVRGYPLVVGVGLARSELMAEVELHRMVYYAVAAFISALVLVFMTMIVRRQVGLRRARDKLWEAANIDALTQLPNRNRLHDIVNFKIDSLHAPDGRFTLALVDIDNFKLINDTLGHDAGDVVLRTAARRIRKITDAPHIVARLGGDEFAILFCGPDSRQAADSLVTRIMRVVGRKMSYRGNTIETSISIGLACRPDHADSWGDIFRAADLALYRAKQTGRNRAVIFEPGMLAEVENRFSMVKVARAAVRNNRIVPFYQPEIDLRTGTVVGLEALARIARHEEDSLCMPAEFLSGLEDPEVGRAFGMKMLEMVVCDVARWRSAGLDIKRVAVNASDVELRADDYARRVLALLRANDVPADHLEIEVTETAAFDDKLGVIKRNLDMLASEGIAIALDDFGTGFASLTHLKSLPVTKVKIDRSFVGNIAADVQSRSIVDAIVRLSHGLGKSVVAEGVEDESQLLRLRALDCNFAQGYFFCRPLQFDDVGTFLLRNTLERLLASEPPASDASTGGALRVRA